MTVLDIVSLITRHIASKKIQSKTTILSAVLVEVKGLEIVYFFVMFSFGEISTSDLYRKVNNQPDIFTAVQFPK